MSGTFGVSKKSPEDMPNISDQSKKERKWPDDFRGFGTNVRPSKQH